MEFTRTSLDDEASRPTSETLLFMRGGDGEDETLQVLDFGPPAAIGGEEEGAAVLQWIGPAGIYQLKVYSTGAAADASWKSLQQPLQELALAVNASAG